jgi:hypothetical protein
MHRGSVTAQNIDKETILILKVRNKECCGGSGRAPVFPNEFLKPCTKHGKSRQPIQGKLEREGDNDDGPFAILAYLRSKPASDNRESQQPNGQEANQLPLGPGWRYALYCFVRHVIRSQRRDLRIKKHP